MNRGIYLQRSIPRIFASQVAQRVWPGGAYSRLGPVRFGDLGDPPLPGPEWVRVETTQSGICATDVAFLRADIDPRVTLAALPGRERVYLGHEMVGRVVETSSDEVAVGDRVVLDTRFQGPTCRSAQTATVCSYCSAGNFMLCSNPARFPSNAGVGGAWSERIMCHASEVYRVPEGLSDDHALLVEPFSLGMRAALKAVLGPQERCLVLGSGMAGLTIVQSVRLLSPDSMITVVARHPHQAEMARRLGADRVLTESTTISDLADDAGATTYRDLMSTFVMGGYPVIYDCVGSPRTLNTALRLAAAGGRVVLVGINMHLARLDVTPLWHQEVQLVGVLAHGSEKVAAGDEHTYDLVCRALLAGQLSTNGFITDRFPLHQWREAIRVATQRRRGVVRVVLETTA